MMRPPDPARSRAVLVGTAEYTEDALLPGVPAVRNNVRDLQRLLTEGRPGAFSTESTRTVIDAATPRDLGLPLLEAARQAEDVFLVYYAGHGLIGHERRELYLGLSKSVSEAPSFTAFPFQGIREAFLATPARNRVLILDCCFSGRAITGGLSGTYEPLIDQMEITGTYTLTSAAANEPARFQDGERHTAFTGELLLTLRDGIPTTSSAEVTLGALFRHLKRVLPAKGLPEPQQCGTDTAEFLILTRPRPRARRGPVSDADVGGPPGTREGLLARWDLGRRLGEEGQTGEAMRLLNEVVPDLTRTLGPDDPATLVGRINLAYWTGREGDTDEALRLSTAAVSDMTRVLGPHHRATLVGQSQLAYWMGESGRHHEALSLTTSVLTDLVRVLGPDDRETLIGRGRLARWTGEASDPAAAARLTGELIPDLSRVLGAEDRETFTGRMNLAQWTGRAGGSKRAVRLLTDLVPDVSWALGPDDRHALLSRSRLAHWSGAAGRRRRARRLFAAAVPDLVPDAVGGGGQGLDTRPPCRPLVGILRPAVRGGGGVGRSRHGVTRFCTGASPRMRQRARDGWRDRSRSVALLAGGSSPGRRRWREADPCCRLVRPKADLVVDVLRDEMQLLAEVGQPGGDGVQLGRAASGTVGATPLGGGFEHLMQAGHRADSSVMASRNRSVNSSVRAAARRSYPSVAGMPLSGLAAGPVVGRRWGGVASSTAPNREPVTPRRLTAAPPCAAWKLRNRQLR
ncbi:Tetratricopeptide repeat protein [Streptomyces griseofuscus]|uniref:Tetratricopeptide repeat protein n=1 Tax=Streptomyces griseofuscus TaxID=146922 RepID=A0A7H1PWA7_9ACTN|nr:Tetratricopeptide repeat protein [Streptomyces griseofuscus]